MNIFLTGFPGFIAGRLVEKLALPDARFFLLVQPAFVEKAKLEVERIAALSKTPLDNFYLFEGDITGENLGLPAEDLEFLKNETTDVFHLAAIYDLGVAREPALRVNVEGTQNVNAFVRQIKNLNRYNYISTCYVAGKRTGVILETELEHEAGFRNFYEETKYLAEMEVDKLKDELPTTIYRPSVVVGDSRTGETAKYDGIYYLILYLKKFPSLLTLFNIGNPRVKLNLVPVDFVVNSIAALAQDQRTTGKTFQLADPFALTTQELFDTISQTLSQRKSAITIPTGLVENSLLMPVVPSISGLPHSAVPYFFIEQTYDTSLADEFLAPHGVSCPPFPAYVENLVAFLEKNPKL
ncbi:MAG TPA: SDR family oxidoreductase [Pyrinomonadaceae bacterium]|nr:SDR family oxidoreductase [Pyrinomonadaceae bacterium]